jgi:hypothetical protein
MLLWVAMVGILGLEQGPRVNVPDSRAQSGITSAVLGAQARLARPECQKVFTDFQDVEGRLLLERLQASRDTPADYLMQQVWFVDGGDTPPCRRDGTMAAFTVPGHHVIRVCGTRFAQRFERERVAAEIIVIHEMLHTLGLGENPPSSRDITAQVTRRCGGS